MSYGRILELANKLHPFISELPDEDDWGQESPMECLESIISLAEAEIPTWSPENQHELYDYADWGYDVANGDTNLGYHAWVEHNIESHEGDDCTIDME